MGEVGQRMKKKATLSSLFDKKWLVLILSFFLAVVVWIFVTYTIDTNISITIHNVPVIVDDKDAAYRSYGLHVVDYDPFYVDVVVSGDRSVVNNLTADNIRVAPIYANVEHPGVFPLNLSVSRVNTQQTFQMTLQTKTATITFDTEAQKTLTVTPRVENFVTADGLVGGTISVSPSEITVSGPEGVVDRVESAVARYDLEGVAQSASLTVSAGVMLLDGNGNEISQENLMLSEEEAEINIPVLKTGTLPLDIEFINVPDGFDVSTIEYTLSRDAMKVFGPVGVVENLQEKIVGRIDLATFELGKEYRFEVVLPENLRTNDDFDSVTVTFPSGSLSSRRVRVTEFAVDNLPMNFEVEIQTPVITNVSVIGSPDEIENLLETSVIAILDASRITLESGEFEYTVSFAVPGSSSLWVAGRHTVLVSVTSS